MKLFSENFRGLVSSQQKSNVWEQEHITLRCCIKSSNAHKEPFQKAEGFVAFIAQIYSHQCNGFITLDALKARHIMTLLLQH